jgi:hypothetical protein
MSELVAQVKDEQSYIIVRERVHRNTAESTNARIKWWSIFQLMVLIGQGFFQVWWLKRFFEVTNICALQSAISKYSTDIFDRSSVLFSFPRLFSWTACDAACLVFVSSSCPCICLSGVEAQAWENKHRERMGVWRIPYMTHQRNNG